MKAMAVKMMKIGLPVVAFFILCSQAMPLVPVSAPLQVPKPQPVLPPPGVKYLEKVEDLVFEMTNQARQAKGLAPLVKDAELRTVARAYNNDMLVRRFFDHTTPDGVSFSERISCSYGHRVNLIGENIWSASGYNPNNIKEIASEIMDSWMNSPDHRENLLDPDFTHLGVGVSARHDRIRATQEFVRRFEAFAFGNSR